MGQWVTAWAYAQRATCFTRWEQDSFSYTVKNNLYGTAIRFKYSNWYGFDKCDIKRVTLTHNAVTYELMTNGQSGFSVKPGKNGDIYSDATEAAIVPGEFTINIQFESFDKPESGQTFMTPPGVVMILQAIEVLCDEKCKVIAVLGDSITHWGKWTYPLMTRFYGEHPGRVALFEMAINGSRLLNGSPKDLKSTWGVDAVARLEHDILPIAGLTDCVIALGLNDLCIREEEGNNHLTFDSYIEKVKEICERLHDAGKKSIGLTICPRQFDEIYTVEKNELRKQINKWIIEEAPFDMAFDIAKIVKNSEDTELDVDYAWEDGCHINEKAGEKIADYLSAMLRKGENI